MIHRRQFLTSVGGAVGAAAVDSGAQAAADPSGVAATTSGNPVCCSQAPASLVDFRYRPPNGSTFSVFRETCGRE